MLPDFIATGPSLFRNFPQPSAELDLLDPAPHHFATYYGHIAFGVLAVLTAVIALYAIKGSKLHRTAGKIYLIGMGIAALTALLTITASTPGPIVTNSGLALYAGGGAYLAARKQTRVVLRAERILFVLGLLILIGFTALASRVVMSGAVPLAAPVGVGGPMLVLVLLDLNYLFRGDAYRASHRLQRHVSRIAWVLLLTVRNPVNELRDVIGINQETVTFAPYLVAFAILAFFGPRAAKMDRARARAT